MWPTLTCSPTRMLAKRRVVCRSAGASTCLWPLGGACCVPSSSCSALPCSTTFAPVLQPCAVDDMTCAAPLSVLRSLCVLCLSPRYKQHAWCPGGCIRPTATLSEANRAHAFNAHAWIPSLQPKRKVKGETPKNTIKHTCLDRLE